MVTIDWDRIANSIAHDATLRWIYTDGDDHCVLGGLAVDYGVSLPEGESNESKIIDVGDFAARLSRATGLDILHLENMQWLNDYHSNVEKRREALLAWVERQRARIEKEK